MIDIAQMLGATTHTKPHIKRFYGLWRCVGNGVGEFGQTPKSAYEAWKQRDQVRRLTKYDFLGWPRNDPHHQQEPTYWLHPAPNAAVPVCPNHGYTVTC